jgi:hypothetical protein
MTSLVLFSASRPLVNDPSFFKHHRWGEQKNGQKIFKPANLKKSIYSLKDLRLLLVSANKRYLVFISDNRRMSPTVIICTQ